MKTQFSHLQTQPLKRINSRNTNLVIGGSKTQRTSFPRNQVSHTKLGTVEYRSQQLIPSPMKAKHHFPMPKRMSMVVTRQSF